jgi:hypothetical protein
MAGWLRRAGHIRLLDGQTSTWSVAEGRRGRRWREAVRKREAPGIRHSLLLEIDPDGRFAHLELATPAGLLTLHPEGDATLHGNAVTERGIEHVRGLAWDPAAIVLVDGSLISCLAALPGLATAIDRETSATVRVLRIAGDLRRLVADEEVRRGSTSWSFAGSESIVVDADGLMRTPATIDWPLEEDA